MSQHRSERVRLSDVRARVEIEERRDKFKKRNTVPSCAQRDRAFLLKLIEDTQRFLFLRHEGQCSANMGMDSDCTCGATALRKRLEE